MAGNSFKLSTVIEEAKRDWPAVVLVIMALAAGVVFYQDLPDKVPAHWNLQGEVDRYASKFWGAFGIPLLAASVYIMMLVAPYFDPKRDNYSRFGDSYRILKIALVAVLTLLYAVVLLSAMGFGVPVDRVVIIALGLMFMVIGNMMGRFRHNYFVGIKTPWTLASEQVWRKTHRLAARIWVPAGLVCILAGAVLGGERGFPVFFGAIGLAVLAPVIYSFAEYRKEKC